MKTYALSAYADSLNEFGEPYRLPNCGGSVLKRRISGTDHYDAMGGYPIFACEDWSGLQNDLSEIDQDHVCLSLVTDPHGNHDETLLNDCFDHVAQFKQHYIVDLETPLDKLGSRNRRKKARRALQDIEVDKLSDPSSFVDEWCALYEVLIKRHEITGARRFSRDSFEKQLSLPGVDVIKASHAGETVGALVMFWHGDVVYGHLCAISERGYDLGVTHALDWYSFQYYAGKARLLDLGGGLSMSHGNNGLDDYKQGWATGTLPVYFCGRIFNPSLYEEITKASGVGHTSYFPAYRDGEYMTAKKVGMDHGH